MMKKETLSALVFVLLAGCTMVQKPASVVETPGDLLPVQQITTPNAVAPAIQPKAISVNPVALATSQSKSLGIADLAQIAKRAANAPTMAKKYAGETLQGQAKFVKTPKGNPNAVVADVRVTGLGEVSIWCRNVVGNAPAGRLTDFEGTLTGSVYTSEDFSHDVTMKDCRFRE